MKTRVFILAAVLFSAIGLRAQQNMSELYEVIPLTPYISAETNLAPDAEALLLNRMRQAALKHGLSAMENQVYVLTTSVNVITKELTATVPQNWIVEIEAHFFIGNGVDGTLYASTAITRKGVGASEEKAYLNAIKAISANDKKFKPFFDQGKKRIIEELIAQQPQPQPQEQETTEEQPQLEYNVTNWQ